MKLHSKITDFIIFLLIFIIILLPPFFAQPLISNNSHLAFFYFPLQNLILFIISLEIYIFYKEKQTKKSEHYFFYKFLFPFTTTFGILLFISFIFKAISLLAFENDSSLVIKPDNFTTWFFAILSFILSAFLEEVIYRFYCPLIFKKFLSKIKNNKIVFILSEGFALILFAFAHYYLGIFSVINAALAHIILRICFAKTKDILPGFISHSLYNVISLMLL